MTAAKNRKTAPPAKPDLSIRVESSDALAGIVPTRRRVEAGSFLFRAGDKGLGVFRLGKGKIQLQRVTPDGTVAAMHTVRLGEIFAEASFFSGKYHCDALAIGETEVLLYPALEMTAYLRDDPQTLWTFAAELARRIQGLRTRLELKQIRSAPQRLLQFVRLRCDAAGSLRIDGTLMHLADELGLTREALYRALATLESKGLIDRQPGQIRLRVK